MRIFLNLFNNIFKKPAEPNNSSDKSARMIERMKSVNPADGMAAFIESVNILYSDYANGENL